MEPKDYINDKILDYFKNKNIKILPSTEPLFKEHLIFEGDVDLINTRYRDSLYDYANSFTQKWQDEILKKREEKKKSDALKIKEINNKIKELLSYVKEGFNVLSTNELVNESNDLKLISVHLIEDLNKLPEVGDLNQVSYLYNLFYKIKKYNKSLWNYAFVNSLKENFKELAELLKKAYEFEIKYGNL